MTQTPPSTAAPAELQALQMRFTTLLRTPLSTRSGSFAPDLSQIDPALSAAVVDGARANAAQGLGVYQRQYWLRLFTVMQQELPLSARLIGLYRFNQLVQHYLTDCPPEADDLGRVADRFRAWRDAHASVFHRLDVRVAKPALSQALAIDQAWRQVWSAPAAPRFQPGADDAAALPRMQLVMARTHALVEDDWPLVELRRSLMTADDAEQIALPTRLGSTRHWLIFRTGASPHRATENGPASHQTTGAKPGIAQLRLEPRQALLYELCTTLPLEQAIARLQQQASRSEREALVVKVRTWFAQSMELGLWSSAQP